MTELDPKLTFDFFVVGPANRLATAAAKRAAESPGTSYNPLFVYSASGLGKSHILVAVAHHAQVTSPEVGVEYMSLEDYLAELTTALGSGSGDPLKDRYGHLDILLLDDVQFLAGQNEAQEMLLRTLDQLSASGSQIVLASDRPPAEIDGLKASQRDQELGTGVAEALARYPFKNVRELGGALNRIFATQDLEERQVTPEDVAALMGDERVPAEARGRDDFGHFLDDVSGAVAFTVEAQEEPWRKAIRETLDAAEREGFSGQRLKVLQGGNDLPGWEEVIGQFKVDVQRLRQIEHELDQLGNPWPEAAQGVLKDPDRVAEAEALLTSVRERQRPFPRIGDGPTLEELHGFPSIALKAVQQLVGPERPEYNPLYLWAKQHQRGRALLGAAGRTFQRGDSEARMAVTSVKDFADDFIRVLGEGVAGAWRERWWTVDLLLVHGVEELSETERAQDEFFHLFEALKRRGARVLLVADRPPAKIPKIDERLRSRFEGGLVLEVEDGDDMGEIVLVDAGSEDPDAISSLVDLGLGDLPQGDESWGREDRETLHEGAESGGEGTGEAPRKGGSWFPSAENVVLHWPRIQEFLQEELD
jgi:chromosomal replication initiation ATPase DnaA